MCLRLLSGGVVGVWKRPRALKGRRRSCCFLISSQSHSHPLPKMSFFGRSGSSSSGAPSSSSSGSSPLSGSQDAKKMEVMNQVRQELASAHLQELVNKMTDKCYNVCKPSGRDDLSYRDKTCLSSCSDRFLEAFDIVSRTYVSRLSIEKNRAAAQLANPSSGPGGESLL